MKRLIVLSIAGFSLLTPPLQAQEICNNGRDDDNDDLTGNRAGVLVMAIDPRIIYTDTMHVNAGHNGVVLSFAQNAGTNQPLVTARVGMSREQARSVISTLQASLDKTEPRQLPAGKKPVTGTDKASKADKKSKD